MQSLVRSKFDHVVHWHLCFVAGLLIASQLNVAQARGATPAQAAVCRVSNQHGGVNELGSGTLIDKTADGREGLVLTCAHLFRDGVGELRVTFADGKLHRARLVDVDSQADLAALAIGAPAAQPAEVSVAFSPSSQLAACGYGPNGVYRCAVGCPLGEAASAGRTSLQIRGAVRSGDSGGGVFDEQGRLVAVIWGEAEGVTYASYGQPLQRFLGRVLGRQTTTAFTCPGGVCPLPRTPRVAQPVRTPGSGASFVSLQQQIDELRRTKQDRGEYLTRGELPDWQAFARREELSTLQLQTSEQHASLLEQLQTLDGRALGKAAGTTAVGLLGLSGPAGWAVIAATSLGGWLLGRSMKRRVGGAGGRRRRRFL